MKTEIIKVKDKNYLSEVLEKLPSHVLIDKGITGCGGTTVELKSKRDSIILCPTRNLVTSKSSLGYLGVTGNTKDSEIKNYINSTTSYKKILATYDSLERLMNIIPNYQDYFLLIDEYHLLFNDYSFRTEAIQGVLKNYTYFKNWAFMTATPLKEEFILQELKDVDQLKVEWKNSVPVHITIKDTYYVQKELQRLIDTYQDRNLHIFLNSISTIYKITDKMNPESYRVVCSENSKTKIKNFSKITSPIKKYNFYTSCSFEGADIFDENGFCIILSDTNISTTVLDISTKVRQVCGRLRNSKYKDEVIMILNTNKHRYAGITDQQFKDFVNESERLGKIKANKIKEFTEDEMKAELRTYNPESYSNIYLNKYKNEIYYDINLKNLDIYNYNLISEIYNNSISVMSEMESNNIVSKTIEDRKYQGLKWVNDLLDKDKEYTFNELEEIFKPLFIEKGYTWNKISTINTYFPTFKKRRKLINRERYVIYKFI